MVGHEAGGAHQHPVGVPAGRQVVDHGQDVGADPRLRRSPGRLPGDAPPAPLGQAHPLGYGGGGGAQLVGVRVAGGQDALGQRVGGEQHLRVGRQPGQRRAHLGGEELEVGGLQVPAVDPGERDAAAGGGGTGPLVVLADRERRPVRRQHQAHDAAGGHRLDGGLDGGRGVLQPEHHGEPAGRPLVERGLQPCPLGLGALGQRRQAADGLVAAGQLGQQLGRGRSTAADVRVVRQDLVARAGRAVGHQQHGGAVAGHASGSSPCT